MAIRRKCRGECGNGRRCLEHLWFDVMFRGEIKAVLALT